jgi:hypothetical protein
MRFLPLVCALVLASGCGSPRPIQEEYAKLPSTPPDNPGISAAPEPAHQEDYPVAFIDKTPVMWREVVDYSMSSRGKELIDKYILWKLRKDRLDELGIRNSPDDLKRRAEIIVSAYKKKVGDEQFKKDLAARRMTEGEYLDTFVRNAEFDEHVKNEKAVTYALLTEPSIEVDTVAFTDQQEANAFAVLAGRLSFDEAVQRLQTAPAVQGKVGYWPRHRFPQGLAPDVIAATPDLEKKLFAMKKGQTSGVETAKSMLVVMHVVNTHPGASTPYSAIADKVAAEVLRQPPSTEQITLWMERLTKSRIIRYEDRNPPRNQNR